MNASELEKVAKALIEIGRNLHTQDNRATSHPAFCVQVCERIGPIMEGHEYDYVCYHDHEMSETYYADRHPDEWNTANGLDKNNDLPDRYTACAYIERWKTVQTCLTSEGCKRHLELNGHNYRHYFGTRVYVDSFHRNEEMILIRKVLMDLYEEEKDK